MVSITVYSTWAMLDEWLRTGTYVMGEVLTNTIIPFENFARLSTWLFFSATIGWYCVTRVGWKRTTSGKMTPVRLALVQLMLLGFTIICLYEVLWNFSVLAGEVSAGIKDGIFPDIDTITIAYPDESRPWNLIFATKIFLTGFIVSAHAFYLSTRPRKVI